MHHCQFHSDGFECYTNFRLAFAVRLSNPTMSGYFSGCLEVFEIFRTFTDSVFHFALPCAFTAISFN